MTPAHAPATVFGWTTAGFAAQLTAAASYKLSLASQVSDYTRDLPANTRTGTAFASVFAGASGSSIWLMALGGWIAGHLGATDALVGLADAGNGVVHGFGTVVVVDSVITIAAVMGMGASSGALTLVTAENSCRSQPVTVARRVFWTAVVAAGSTVVALLLPGSAIAALNAVLTIMLYLLVPWTRQRRYLRALECFRLDLIRGRRDVEHTFYDGEPHLPGAARQAPRRYRHSLACSPRDCVSLLSSLDKPRLWGLQTLTTLVGR